MPLSYGGGIRDINQAQKLFNLGIEKIVIQNSFLEDSEFIKTLTNRFGSQSIVVSIDIHKNWRNIVRPYNASKNKRIKNKSLKDLMYKAVEFGVGEIFLQFVHIEGTKLGSDINLIPKFAKTFPLPIVVSGGISSLDDVESYIKAGADAVAGGAFFIYQGPYEAVLLTYPSQSELDLIFK